MYYTKKQLNKKIDELNNIAKKPDLVDCRLGRDSHLYARHVDATTTDHIERVLDTTAEKPTINSTSFESKEKMQELVSKCIRDSENKMAMAKWLLSDSKRELSLTYRSKNEKTGTGIAVDPRSKKIAEYETNEMTVRFAKDDTAKGGFVVVTAFPQLTANAIPTKRDITPDMHATKAYQKGNPVDKTFYDIVSHPDYDPNKVSIGIAGSSSDHHTIYLSHVDEKDPAYTHRLSLNPKKTLFSTHMSVDQARKPVKTDFIKEHNFGNQISRFHRPEDMADVYKKMPYFGALMEYSYNRLDQNVKDDKEYLKRIINDRKKYKESQKTKTDKAKTPVQKTERQEKPNKTATRQSAQPSQQTKEPTFKSSHKPSSRAQRAMDMAAATIAPKPDDPNTSIEF